MLETSLPLLYPAGKVTKVAMTTTHADTVLSSTTQAVELCSDTDCFFKIGPGVVTTLTTGTYLPAKTPRQYACNAGDTVSAITAISGNLYITEAM